MTNSDLPPNELPTNDGQTPNANTPDPNAPAPNQPGDGPNASSPRQPSPNQPAPNEPPANQPPPQGGVANSFTNPQTALSLPVAASAITMTWKISGVLWAPLGQTPWIPVILSAFVGMAFYFTSDARGTTWRDKIPFILAAFFNTVTLAASVLGLSGAITDGATNP